MGGEEHARHQLANLLDYARIAWDTMLKEFKKATTTDNVFVKFNLVWGGMISSIINRMTKLCGILECLMLD